MFESLNSQSYLQWLLTRPHHLHFPQTEPPTGYQMFNYLNLWWGAFSQTTTAYNLSTWIKSVKVRLRERLRWECPFTKYEGWEGIFTSGVGGSRELQVPSVLANVPLTIQWWSIWELRFSLALELGSVCDLMSVGFPCDPVCWLVLMCCLFLYLFCQLNTN